MLTIERASGTGATLEAAGLWPLPAPAEDR